MRVCLSVGGVNMPLMAGIAGTVAMMKPEVVKKTAMATKEMNLLPSERLGGSTTSIVTQVRNLLEHNWALGTYLTQSFELRYWQMIERMHAE